ncbi:MATE family efflux transporter [Psychroserpens sp.]|uniref:MATE family efflux transporter n=1 Tax=Psychroserpens sp. TaxID=2020870 RepID=UPI001B12CD1B|nr:MATE family efflux transporter [Psychroserpens sp.]MBO6607519.1 MATE family efflux transporter [Psychroserpens sp.]MBO6630695.1 MATE family efflux transporter [Psychroserpens sp.]MBO6655180.1 MATE family efflux transporter [Psychroserpens sp.]MBO6683230.1 MATE family efflux transporter [Psychroserpens sp.]MBO6749795.1 MATE family efflux transporter [Psychroserpens sp.]
MSKSLPTIQSFFKNLKIAVSGKEQEFTKGSIRRAVFMLSIPMILEMLMESIFAVVDIFYVSRVSVNAVATIGLTESVVTLVYAVAIGLSMAATAIVARRIGENDREGASKATVQVIFLGVAVAAIISVIGILFPKDILALMGGEPDLIAEGYGYTQVLLGGNVTIMLLFLINAVFRGAGDASIAMWTLILSNGLNIILDPMFIFGFGPIPAFGVEGAAIATTIGRGSAVLFQLAVLFYGWSKIKIGFKDLVLRVGVMLNLVKVSLGGIGQFLIGTSSWVFLMRIMSEFGSEVLAGYTIAIRVMMFTFMPAWGMSNAAATLVGQNLGAKQPDRAEQSVWQTGKYCAVFMGLVSLAYLFFAPEIISWFTNEANVIENGSLCLRVIAAGYIFYAYGMVVINSFNGAGDTETPTIINFICFWLFQLPFAYLMAITFDFGPTGVFLAIVLAEVLISVIAIIWFRKGKWKLKQV